MSAPARLQRALPWLFLMFLGCGGGGLPDEAPSDAKAIVSVTILETTATPSGTDIPIPVPAGTDVTALIPTIVHTGVSVSPDSGVARDFTEPVPYTVTAEDGSTEVYIVTVTVAAATTNEMLTFRVGDLHATISRDDLAVPGSIVQPLPVGTDLSAVTPTLFHNGVSCAPASGETQDFSNGPVTYTVTGEDGAVQAYLVTVVDAGSVQAPRVVIVTPGQTSSLSLRGLDPLGEPDPDATYTFTNSHPEIATVDASGEVTGLELGFTRIDIASPLRSGATTWAAVKALMDIAVGESVDGDISASDGWAPFRTREGLPSTSYYSDVYRVVLPVGTVTISVETDWNLDSILTIADADGNVVAWNDDAERGELGIGSRVQLEVEIPGTFFIDVSTFDALETGSYTLSLTP